MRKSFPAFATSLAAAACAILTPTAAPAQAAAPEALQIETKIALGQVNGRIDHMAIDLARGRLFVAELGNDTVAVVDVKSNQVVQVIAGLKEPQGVGYVPSTDTLYVANARDGSVQLFRGERYTPNEAILLGSDPDNIRFEAATGELLIGYGGGGLAIIDPVSVSKVADIPLPGHPESFQRAREPERVYVNIPDARMIAVLDPATGKMTARWRTQGLGGNFAMALDESAHEVIVAFRHPAKLAAFAMADGHVGASADACGDIDDVFVDAKRQRIYASCGEGFVDVLDKASAPWRRLARVRTVAGARTSLFVPQLDRLFVAVRASGSEPAAIWVLRPTP
jgi:prepilin-type processing-associated H-X9-DG protein